jgi:hypothetical protein
MSKCSAALQGLRVHCKGKNTSPQMKLQNAKEWQINITNNTIELNSHKVKVEKGLQGEVCLNQQ